MTGTLLVKVTIVWQSDDDCLAFQGPWNLRSIGACYDKFISCESALGHNRTKSRSARQEARKSWQIHTSVFTIQFAICHELGLITPQIVHPFVTFPHYAFS